MHLPEGHKTYGKKYNHTVSPRVKNFLGADSCKKQASSGFYRNADYAGKNLRKFTFQADQLCFPCIMLCIFCDTTLAQKQHPHKTASYRDC